MKVQQSALFINSNVRSYILFTGIAFVFRYNKILRCWQKILIYNWIKCKVLLRPQEGPREFK